MLQIVKCPACAAPLECDGDAFEKCDFCGSKIVVNPNNSFSQNSFGFEGLLKNAQQLKEVLRLVRSGNKIEAIKRYREIFGVSLKEAKDAVDQLESGQSISFQHVQFSNSNSGDNQLNEILRLARNGNKIEAIKRYKETFDVGLAEAKDAVERLERGQNAGFYSPPSININPEAVKKTVKIFGGAMSLVFLIGIMGALLGVGVAIYAVYISFKQMPPNNPPTFENSKQISVSSAFAKEVLRFGGEGNGAGKFTDNRTIAVDGEGRIYSADYSGGRVQVFDKDGKFLNQWFVKDREAVIFSLTANRKGMVFVTQPGGKITAYEGASGNILKEAKLDLTSSLYPTLDGKIIAASRDDILLIDENLKAVSTFKNAAENAGMKGGFNYLAVNGLGEIFAVSRFGKDLAKFSADGKFVDRFKIKSATIDDMAIDPKGRIFLTDASGIYVYDADGNLVTSFDANQCFALIFNEQGELLTATRPFIVKYSVNQ